MATRPTPPDLTARFKLKRKYARLQTKWFRVLEMRKDLTLEAKEKDGKVQRMQDEVDLILDQIYSTDYAHLIPENDDLFSASEDEEGEGEGEEGEEESRQGDGGTEEGGEDDDDDEEEGEEEEEFEDGMPWAAASATKEPGSDPNGNHVNGRVRKASEGSTESGHQAKRVKLDSPEA